MSNLNIQAVMGPRYEIVINQDQLAVNDGFNIELIRQEPLRLNVGTGYNVAQNEEDTLNVGITAAEVLNAYRAVGYDGFHTQPDADSLANYAGVTIVAGAISDKVRIVRVGLLKENGWNWTPNAPVFSTTDGVLTQTAPATGNPIRRIGWAISATELNLDPYPIIGV